MRAHFETVIVDGLDLLGIPNLAGTSGADEIISGTDAPRFILAGSGSDFVYAGLGPYSVNAGAGDDVVFAPGPGHQYMPGFAANGAEGNDLIVTGDPSDVITGGSGDDALSGGAGSDTYQFAAGFGDDLLLDFSFAEGDTLRFFSGSVPGNNSAFLNITTFGQLQTLVGAAGLHVADLGHDNVKIDFGLGNSLTLMGSASQFGYASDLAVHVAGTSGADQLLGSDQADLIKGGAGDDNIFGGNGDDVLTGDAGDDEVMGGAGNDIVSGGSGNDYVFGGAGADKINGGTGDDILAGQGGSIDAGDSFQFSPNFGHDIILDFQYSAADSLTFFAGAIDGKNHVVHSTQQLAALVEAGGDTVSYDGVSSTIDFHNGNSLTLTNYYYDASLHDFYILL